MTAQMLHRHAERSGQEAVKLTVAQNGLTWTPKVVPKNKPKLRRRTNAELVLQVLELDARGVVVMAIADTVNIADARVKSIIRAEVAEKAA